MKAYENNGKDFEYLAEMGRIGLCSYVATLNGVTVVSVDGNARKFVDKTNTAALASADGWDETTGGLTTRAQLRWIADETQDEVAAGNLMLVNCHFNNMAHFEAQDEVISLFVLDNYELYTSTLAKAGIRYSFSGHQHAMDVMDSVTQDGYVMYDIETGSTVSYGAGYRIVDFKQKWENKDYSEEVKTTVHSLKGNNNSDNFSYGAYKLTSDLGGETMLTESAVAPSVFNARSGHLYDGEPYLTLVKEVLKDEEGNPVGIGDYLTLGLHKLITMDGLLGNFVNAGLYDRILGMLGGLSESMKSTYDLLVNIVDSLRTLDFPAINVAADGKSFTVTNDPVRGNDLVATATGLLEYLFAYDFSYGEKAGGTTLADIMVDVYGGHLTGAQTAEECDAVKPLLAKLNDGTFVRFLIDTLKDSLLPILERVLNAPIRFNTATPELAEGAGLDITEYYNKKYKKLSTVDGFINGTIHDEGMFKTVDENGYYSLKLLLGDLLGILDPLLSNFIVKAALDQKPEIRKYIDLGKTYVSEYVENGSLEEILQRELLDKYVTDAFCRNLGEYAAYLVGSVSKDDTPDGASWGAGDKYRVFTVVNQTDFNVTSRNLNAAEVYGGKAYVRKNGTDGTLAVVPSAENGLTASMISVTVGSDAGTTKKLKWTTSIDPDVFDKNADDEYEYGATVPESYIQYSLNKNMKNATTVKATSHNKDIELPTIDLGIMYFNMSHRYKLYNIHEVSLEGLKAGKTYYYRLGNDRYGWSDVYAFTTEGGGTFHFMAMTDIQGSVESNYIVSNENMKIATKLFADEKNEIAFIASMGDNVDNGKNIMQYTWWLDDQREIWANNTLITMAGNHEKKNASLSEAVAIPDEEHASDTGFYYSFDRNHAHFIVLDTNDLENNQLSAAQTEWLLADLAKTEDEGKTRWTIVMMHKGPYTAGSHAFDADVIALRAQLTPIFAENGVDLVLQGHDHTYSVSEFINAEGAVAETKYNDSHEVTETDGVLYINLGTMGDKFYDYIYSDEVSIVKRAKTEKKLEKYFTEDGYLELTETPVFADIKVSKNTLEIRAFTIVDGERVQVDEIVFRSGGLSPKDTIIMAVCLSVGGAAIVALAVVLILIKKGKIMLPKRVK